MATFYLDYAGGSDAADGTTFANRWKTITGGPTAARIGPGDTIRIMGSPAPTSLGINGTWTGAPRAVSQSITSSTNATPIVVTKNSHGYVNGDYINITGHTTNTNANGTWLVAGATTNTFQLSGSTGNGVGGASGTVRKINNNVVVLASSLTQNIASTGNRGEGRTAWTASASVTATLNTTDYKQGDVSDSIDIAAGFTTGLAAYKATGLLDLSAYKQVSFWIKQTAGTTAIAGDVSLRLCSDTVGAVSVQTIAIPALGVNSKWIPVTVDVGGVLPSVVNSIALYVDTDRGAQTFLISNIIGCKDSTSADSLTLSSLIGKNSGTETWYGIQSINGILVFLDQTTNDIPSTTTLAGYSGTSETVTTYKRETIKTIINAPAQVVQDSGTSGSVITFSGGWNRTDMTTQTLETWFDGSSGSANGFQISSKNYITFEKIACVRYDQGFSFSTATFGNFSIVAANNNTTYGIAPQACTDNTFTLITAANNNGTGINTTFGSLNNANVFTDITDCSNNASQGFVMGGGSNVIGSIVCKNNGAGGTSGMNLGGMYNIVKNITSRYNGAAGITAVAGRGNTVYTGTLSNNLTYGYVHVANGNTLLYNVTTASNTVGGINLAGSNFAGDIPMFNCTISDSTEFAGAANYTNERAISIKHDATANNHYIYTDGGTIVSDASVTQSGSGISWKFSPTSAIRSANYPLNNIIATIAVNASSLVTVTCYFRRTHANLVGTLRCRGGQIGGVANDVTASMTVGANTWEQLTITFTPNEAGVVEIDGFFYASDGVTTYSGYIDTFAVSQ